MNTRKKPIKNLHALASYYVATSNRFLKTLLLKIYFRCYTSRFLLFALLLYSSSDVISALLFSTLIDKGELGSCFSCPSRSPSPEGEELSRLSVVVRRAEVASILSCPEFRAFSRARTVVNKRKLTKS